MAKFKPGDIAFLIESNVLVRKVIVRKYVSGLVLVQTDSGGGIKVRESRLFRTKEEAAEKIRNMGRTPRDSDNEIVEKTDPLQSCKDDLARTSSAAAAFSPRYRQENSRQQRKG